MAYCHRHSLQYPCYLQWRTNLQGKCWTKGDQVLILELPPKAISIHVLYELFILVLCFLFDKYSWFNLKAGKLKPYTFNFAIKRSWFRQANALQRSISRAPNTLPLSIYLFHFSNKGKRHCWVLNPFLKPYWYFQNMSSKKLEISRNILLSNTFDKIGSILSGL